MLLTSWCKRLADHVAHFLVNIHVCWNIVAQVFLPSHPLAAVQPDEIAETVVDREAQLLVDIQRTREFNFEPLVRKAVRAYQWETLDQEFGKDFLDWLQTGVATVACVSKSRCKGDNPVPSARKRKPATKRQQTQSHRRPRSDMATAEEVPARVRKAYAARRREQAQRCRRAVRRSLAKRDYLSRARCRRKDGLANTCSNLPQKLEILARVFARPSLSQHRARGK